MLLFFCDGNRCCCTISLICYCEFAIFFTHSLLLVFLAAAPSTTAVPYLEKVDFMKLQNGR